MDRRQQILSWDSRGMVSASLAVALGFALSWAGSLRGWEFAIWWPGVGLVAIVVLQREFRCWTCAAVSAWATELLLWRGLFELGWSDAAIASFSHQLSALIAAWGIRYQLGKELTFRSPQQLLLQVLPAILAAPLLGSIFSDLAFSSTLIERLPIPWIWLSYGNQLLGLVLTLPTWLAWRDRPSEQEPLAMRRREERWWLWLMAFVSTLIVVAILDPIAKFPSSAVVLATTSLVALRMDRFATSVAVQVTILTAMASLILSRELDLADSAKLMTWATYVQITGLLCLLTGMTTAMVRETSLRSNLKLDEQNELIRRIFSQSSEVIFSLDRDHRYRIVNEPAGEVVGRPAAEVVGRTIEELCPPAEAARIRQIDAEVMDQGVTLAFEETVMTPSGEKTFLSTKAPLRSGDGSVIGMLAVCRDVTALKKVETELRRNLRRLRELTEWAPVAIAEFDRDRTCVYTNPAMQRLLELSPEESLGSGWQQVILGDSQHVVTSLLSNDSELTRQIEFPLVRATGVRRWILGQSRRTDSEDERSVCWIVVFIDLTESIEVRRRLEELNRELESRVETRTRELKSANEGTQEAHRHLQRAHVELAEAHQRQRRVNEELARALDDQRIASAKAQMEFHERVRTERTLREQQKQLSHLARVASIGELATGLTHELGQPLQAIANYAKGAARRLRIPEPRELETLGTLERIATEARRAADLIGRIRRFARVGDGVAQPLDFEAVLSRSLELCEAEIRSRDFSVRTRVDVAGPPALGDPQEWAQIIINLIVNALEAGEGLSKERRQVDVEIFASETSPWVTLVVEDRGAGIDPAARQWIFEPFRTSKPQGLGLGLSITRTLVEAHRGTIEIQTGRFGGARFVIRVPRPTTASSIPALDTYRPAKVLPAGGSHVEESR